MIDFSAGYFSAARSFSDSGCSFFELSVVMSVGIEHDIARDVKKSPMFCIVKQHIVM